MSKKPPARALPEGVTICGFCDEYEHMAKLADERADELQARLDRIVWWCDVLVRGESSPFWEQIRDVAQGAANDTEHERRARARLTNRRK